MGTDIAFAGPFIPVQGSDLESEDLSSQIDGSRTVFTISQEYQSNRIFVFLNGLYQGPAGGTEISATTTLTFTIATVPLTGDSLTVIYSPLNKP